ncbi:hypothetical protein NEUTE1DRAFT_97314 [Neurospora tetrasperma FGSC 2508]|uniref:Uncharacterized protein n=1 Tax=Neurospora tetrasperma (strain FGSC 2508 / ATCC MYA-4615 / P0657) TaxID=510951 RepID=F8MAH5_NEUT8|nr:uncharacterized protein NEUTE1DRAFT_97314 [Neurospora tetrasperma FGSC 2508]EGO60096.1 hypothetical protein NEUTE1DRAFT_97314 [Neurospora tetrasperma FGSC 2508]EGZ75954.1 hypothetical protein NEUTE2DRAFT_126895 [Neurospora tetrasperma FGSC 2509]
MDPSFQTTRSTASLKWTDYLLKDLDPSDEGWEMSMVLKELAKQYEAYDDQTPHPFGFGDGYNIRGVPEVETAANTNAADTSAANVNNTVNANNTTANTNNKKRPAEAMDQNGNNNNNNHDALHPNKRVMTTHQNYPALPPETIFKVDTQSVYKVRITEGDTPTFKFKSSGPARVLVKLNRGGVAAAAAAAPVPALGVPGAAAPGAIAPPDPLTASGIIADRAPGIVAAQAPAAPDPPAAPSAQATVGTIAAPGTVIPAAPDPAPAVVAFATRASLAASEGVGNVNPMVTGWEGMGFGNMGFVEWSSVSSMSSNTETDSDVA